MHIILGIDTGGTYTDGVVIEADTRKILKKAKARTTPHDLTIGIKECIDNLAYDDLASISMVALSTTLATNAIVEGKGCEVGVVLIGREPKEKLPVSNYAVVGGGHNPAGMPYEPLDEEALIKALDKFKGKVSAIAISGFFSVMNPEHELRAKEIARERLNLPVVCGHQLSTALGLPERTVTAALNARLLPIIADWIRAIKSVLDNSEIKAPIMIVKSDGSLMDIAAALEKPIETILTGPAASIVGACALSGKSDAIILDMGGTTTDIAMIRNYKPKLNDEGAVVGGWLTRVRAAEIYTYGLGGDSYIRATAEKITVGPERVLPLCFAAEQHPHLIKELSAPNLMVGMYADYQKTDCFMLVKKIDDEAKSKFRAEERMILDIIQDRPHSLDCIAKRANASPYILDYYLTRRLIESGIIVRISITPTDILHVLGEYTLWSRAAAELGVALLASQMGISPAEFVKAAEEQVVKDISIALLQSLVGMQGEQFSIKDNMKNIFVKRMFEAGSNEFFGCQATISTPVVGVGAPVKAWLPKACDRLKMVIDIPDHADVANALGAATANIIETVDAIIKPMWGMAGFGVHLPWEFKVFDILEEAVTYATEAAQEWARNQLLKSGAEEPKVSVSRYDNIAYCNYGVDFYIETLVQVVAVGKPNLELI